MFSPEEVKARLSSKLIGHTTECYEEVPSTNDIVKVLDEGALVVADQQIMGRGRGGRRWVSPSGGLWFSTLLKPAIELSSAPVLTLTAGIAVARALSRLWRLAPRLKWPNDVEIDGKKTCGILAEIIGRSEEYKVAIGIGVNANFDIEKLPYEVQTNATTLKKVLGREIDRLDLLVAIVKDLEELYFELIGSGREKILKEWRALSSTLGQEVTVSLDQDSLAGVATDIDFDGGLLMRLSNGSLRKILAGDVTVLRVQD